MVWGSREATYGVSCTVEGDEFTALIFELGESLKGVPPRRNTNRVQFVGALEIGHGEVVQGSTRIPVDRVLVPGLSDSPKTRYVRV